jgi:response regulator RpfG family c-di-GMP phosphodiesterase
MEEARPKPGFFVRFPRGKPDNSDDVICRNQAINALCFRYPATRMNQAFNESGSAMGPEDDVFDALYRHTKSLSVALGYRDMMTRLHSERVRDLSVAIGLHCGLADKQVTALRVGASFHDIGKIGIPDHILLKPADLDEPDWKVMKQHSEIGEKIMLSTGFEGARHAARIIRHHHEHFNGGGYPDGLSGESIPICSRIVAIADSYDAMAITRSYQPTRKHREIVEIMRSEAGTKFDPQLMDVFCEIIERSPIRDE